MTHLGRIVPPYPRERCANVDCERRLSEDHGVYLHRNLENDKLVVLCGECSQQAELTERHRLPLVAL